MYTPKYICIHIQSLHSLFYIQQQENIEPQISSVTNDSKNFVLHTSSTEHCSNTVLPLKSPAVSDPALKIPAVSNTALKSPAVSDPALKTPAVSDSALKTPAVSDSAFKTPAVSDSALKSPAVSDPALKSPAVSDPTLKTPAVSDSALKSPAVSDPAIDAVPLADQSMGGEMSSLSSEESRWSEWVGPGNSYSMYMCGQPVSQLYACVYVCVYVCMYVMYVCVCMFTIFSAQERIVHQK